MSQLKAYSDRIYIRNIILKISLVSKILVPFELIFCYCEIS